jgi:pimeloyl-ACP methyl ester carboxylesterase
MPTVNCNGVQLFYTDTENGQDTVVFSHSYLLDHSHFNPQIDVLKEHYRCIAFDHRGHGQSGKPSSGYEMENLYQDAVSFIEEMGCAPCHFVGLSTGGFIGLRIGIRRPELVKSLIMMDTSADAIYRSLVGVLAYCKTRNAHLFCSKVHERSESAKRGGSLASDAYFQ